MSESTVKAQQCLRAFVDGNYDESLSLIDQVEEPHKLKDDKYGATLLHWAAARGWLNIVQQLLDKYEFHPMCKDKNGYTPVHDASCAGHLDIIQYLITVCKCDPMCKDKNGSTPLHSACYIGHLNVAQYLITECKCDPMCKNRFGNTTLHLACFNGHLRVIEYLLSSGRVNPDTRNILLMTPLSFAKQNTYEVEKIFAKFSKLNTCFSVDSYVNVVLLGNAGAGKSTLAQVIIQTSSGIHLLGRFQNAKAVELHTAGIVPTRIEHQRLGNIILHDLAGQPEYYSSHIAVLENLLQDYPAVFINFVNLCEQEAFTSLHKWITVIENVSQNVSSPCHVVTVASHVDMITQSKFSEVKKKMLEILSSRLEVFNVNAGLMGLDCRKLGGSDLSPFMNTLSKCCQSIRSTKSINMSMYCHMLYTFLENEVRNNIHSLRVDKLCHRMRDRNISENYYVPQEQEEILETLFSLHSTGLITFLKNNHTPDNSWVIVDKRVLLAKVDEVLFAPETFKQYRDISSNTGIVTQSALTQMFPDLDPEMLIHFLCYMKLSMEITSDMLIYTNLQRKHPKTSMGEEKYLFIPALICNVQRPHAMSGIIQFGWCLQCSNPHQFFLPRFLHLLLLHFGYQYVLPKTANNPHHRRCTIWTNGILWSDGGVQTLVEIVDNSQCVLLLMSCEQEFEHNMIKLRQEVIKDILSHQKETCPRLELQEFIIDPSQLDYPIEKPSSLTLYDIEHVALYVVMKKAFVMSYKGDNVIKISDLLLFEHINPDTLSVFAGRTPEILTKFSPDTLSVYAGYHAEILTKRDPVERTSRRGVLFQNMEVIAEYCTQFSSEKPFSLNWDKYGCRIHIPEGSIPPGEVGTLDLYAIYSGPFQFPDDMSPVSAYYFISISHDLLKPAILELQHFFIINNNDDAAKLTFASAATSTGPPYLFRPVDGGCFSPGRYGLIHQAGFCFFSILQKWTWNLGQLISKWIYGVQQEEDLHDCFFGVLYFMIPVHYPDVWKVKLFITQYAKLHFEYIKQEQDRDEQSVNHEWLPFALKDDVDTVSIALLPEEEAKDDKKLELKQWNGTCRKFGKNWEVISSVTEVHLRSVLQNVRNPLCIQIHIEWTDNSRPERSVFRIYFLGMATELNFPVIVPYRCHLEQSDRSLAIVSTRERNLEDEDLRHILRATKYVSEWFTLGVYLKVKYSKLKQLRETFPSNPEHCRQEMFMSWISSGKATWRTLVNVLRNDMNEVALAEEIEKTSEPK